MSKKKVKRLEVIPKLASGEIMAKINPLTIIAGIWLLLVVLVGKKELLGINVAVPALYIFLLGAFVTGVLKRDNISRNVQVMLIVLMMLWTYLLAGVTIANCPILLPEIGLNPMSVAEFTKGSKLITDLLLYSSLYILIPMVVMAPLIYLAFSSTAMITFTVALPTMLILNPFMFESMVAVSISAAVFLCRVIMVAAVAGMLAIIKSKTNYEEIT